MTAEEMENARRKMKLSKADLARQLRTPYRTVQDWLSGARPIPEVCAVAVELLMQKDEWVTKAIIEKIYEEVVV